MSRRPRALAGALVATLVATALTLSVGYWVKDRCTTHVWDGYQYRTSCYNDIFALYSFRGLERRVFPYIHGDGELDNEFDENGNRTEIGDLEYPAGTGIFLGVIAAFVRGGQQFFRANAAGLALFGLLSAALLLGLARDRRRVLYFALAPSLALYAFHNWDLLAVAMMVGALFAFRGRADALAGGLLGLGAATKVFPGLILPALVLARWRETRRAPTALIAAAVAAFVAVNLPILIANPAGWAMPWRFQGSRFPNFETSWFMAYRHLGRFASQDFWFGGGFGRVSALGSLALFAAGAALLVRAEARRALVRPWALAFGLLVVFLLTNKVFSPQYALWLLPFFVLVRLPWYSFAAFAVTEAAVWFAISAFFLASPPLNTGDAEFRLSVVEWSVYVRYAVLAWLLWLSRRVEENVEEGAPARATPVDAPIESPA